MDTKTIDFYLVVELFLLLLIGIGPKIALVPFLDVTAGTDAATKGLVNQVTEIEREGRSVTAPRGSGTRRSPARRRSRGGLDDSRRERRLHAIRTMHLREPRT